MYLTLHFILNRTKSPNRRSHKHTRSGGKVCGVPQKERKLYITGIRIYLSFCIMKTFGDVNQVENVSTLLNELYFSCSSQG